jgi:hypothetical protein
MKYTTTTHYYKKGALMKQIQIWIGLISLVLLLTTTTVEAQDRWNLAIRGGAAFPTQDLNDTDLDTGFGFEGTVTYRFMPHLAAYAGWGWNQFSADQSFAGTDVDFEETGYTFGLQFMHPFGTSKLSYVLQAGGLFNHLEVENNDGEIIADSEHQLGWQLGAGLAIPLGSRWHLLPSVRYQSLPGDLEGTDINTSVDLDYLSVGIDVSWSF